MSARTASPFPWRVSRKRAATSFSLVPTRSDAVSLFLSAGAGCDTAIGDVVAFAGLAGGGRAAGLLTGGTGSGSGVEVRHDFNAPTRTTSIVPVTATKTRRAL